MKHTDWFETLADGESVNAAAKKAEIVQSTLDNQLKRGTLPAESVIKLCRAYNYGVVQGLVDTGYLVADEARGGVKVINWKLISDAELLRELLRRVDKDGILPDSLWTAPLDDDTTGKVIDMATKRKGDDTSDDTHPLSHLDDVIAASEADIDSEVEAQQVDP